MNPGEQRAFERGQESVLNDLFAVIAELEKSRNADSSHGRAQLYIMRRIVAEMCGDK